MLKKRFIMGFGYLFSIFLTLLTYTTTNSFGPIIVGLLELFILILLTDIIAGKSKIIAYIIKSVLLLFYNIQMSVLLFSGTYTLLIMLTNLDSVKALSGQLPLYLSTFIMVVILSFLPVYKINFLQNRIKTFIVYFILIIEMLLILVTQKSFSPYYSIYGVLMELKAQQDYRNSLEKMPDYSEKFYQSGIDDALKKPETLPDKPNIVLIFAEGLSQHIIDDSRGIMPNIKRIQENSINFKNYYNHTFATYRGLQGQLYSGYQLGNFDESGFTSIQSILENEGYNTTFINTEPENKEFTDYVSNFEFNNLASSEKLDGEANTMTDKDALNLLMDKINKYNKKSDSYFLTMYTFGTHASSDSPDMVFGDGNDPQINKFYNLDYQFGTFIEEFNKSEASDDTIIIFTTDHATFVDAAYLKSFPNINRNHGMVDQIPFFIYQKGKSGESIDVQGKNSLNLAPTILDYIDVSAPNYFLGTSLFSDEDESPYDTYFVSEGTKLSTDKETDSTVHSLTNEELLFLNNKLEKYFSTKEKRLVVDE